MFRKLELVTLAGLFLFVALLMSFAPSGRLMVSAVLTQASTVTRTGVDQPSPPASFKWRMPNRFGPKANGIVDYHWTEATQTYDSSYVNPGSWRVEFDACTPAVGANSTFQWEIDGAVRPNPNPTACTFAHEFTEQKTYAVKLTVTSADGQVTITETNVTVRDLLIVSVGDSFASGQGNPDIPKQGSTRAMWVDNLCNRSAFAGPAQAALSIEQADPHTSVTFISLACSGAAIETGLTGAHVKGGKSLRPQIDKVKEVVNGRPIDALLISIGGNDVGFADLVAKCILQHNCSTNAGTLEILRNGLDSLAPRYQALSDKINGLQAVTKVFITEYPDLARDENRQFCHRSPTFDILRFLRREEARWASEQVIQSLNDKVNIAAKDHGWIYVGGIADKFVTHGYCADEHRWVRTFRDAKRIQGTDNKCEGLDFNSIKSCVVSSGSVHPNEGGHAWFATRLIEEMRAAGVVPPVAL